jgi:hypothetical protein
MKGPHDKPDKLPLTRADVETILEIERKRAALVEQLKQSILNGDSILEHQLAREVCGLPKETMQ